MARVTVLPLGAEIELKDGTTVFHAAVALGYRWPTVCNGMGSCRTCYMRVLEGAEHFDEPDDWEQEGLDEIAGRSPGAGSQIRLACQAIVRGDAVVHKTGVKRPAVGPAAASSGESERKE